MDKTIKGREIGYKPGQPVSKVLEDRANAVTKINTTAKLKMVPNPARKAVAPIKKEEPVTPKQVVSWIQKHPMFKWGVMCTEIGIDRGNFSRTMESEDPKISPETLSKIVAVIKQYGFVG